MKCQSCGKNSANIKYYENINGKKQILYFCEDCAKKLGFSNFSDFSNLFSPIFTTIPEFNLLEKRKCAFCGYTIDHYLNTGMLGCEKCYDSFEENIDELLYKINGKNRHVKIKNEKEIKDSNEDKILILQEKLEELIKEEKYEQAAILRDEIKLLRKEKR